MPLKQNAHMVFADYWIDDQGTHAHFVCNDPGPGEPTDYFILFTDSDLGSQTTVPGLIAMAKTKLQNKARGALAASKLDQLLGQEIVI